MKNQPIWRRFLFAWAGLKASIRTESSFRADVVAFVLVVLLLLALRPAPLWWGLMLFASAMVMVVELLNTAVEKLIDHLHPDLHETVGVVKDTLAAAVLVTCTGAVCILLAFIYVQIFAIH